MPPVLRSRDGRGRVRSAQVAPRSWPQSYTDEVPFSGIDEEIFIGDLGVVSCFFFFAFLGCNSFTLELWNFTWICDLNVSTI